MISDDVITSLTLIISVLAIDSAWPRSMTTACSELNIDTVSCHLSAPAIHLTPEPLPVGDLVGDKIRSPSMPYASTASGLFKDLIRARPLSHRRKFYGISVTLFPYLSPRSTELATCVLERGPVPTVGLRTKRYQGNN